MADLNFSSNEHSAQLILSIIETDDSNLKILISDFIQKNGPSQFLKEIEQFDLPFDFHLKLQSLRQLIKYIDSKDLIEH